MSKKTVITGEQADVLAGFAAQLPKASDVTATPRRAASPGDTAKEAAFRDSYAAGYGAGFEQGLRESLEQDARRAEQFREEMQAVLRRVDSAMELWYQKAENGLANLARETAQRVIADEIQQRPEAILSVVREALGRVSNSTHARIRINPFDLPAIAERKELLMQACNSVHEIDLVADETMLPGGTIIESESGVVDASVISKLALLLPEEAA